MSKPLRLGGKSTRPSSRSSRSTSSRAASSAPAPRVGVGRSGVPRPDYGNVKPKKTHIQLESGRQYYDSADDNMKGVFRSSDADGGGAAPNALGLAGGREASGGGGGAAGSFADVRKEHEQRQHGAHSGDRVEAPQNPQVDDGQPSPQRAHPQSVASPITSTRALTGKKVSSSSNLISASSPSSAAAGSSPEQVQNHSVLLVEDVRVSQRIARVALSRAHFHVEVATDGEDAVNKFKQALVDANSTSSAPSAGALGLGVQAAPDNGADDESGSASLTRRGFAVVLMDIQLPKMNGIEATRIIRELEAKEGTPPAAIFGLTGSVADEELEEYKHAGMNGCIAKGNVLKTAVEKALAAYHANPDEFFVSKV